MVRSCVLPNNEFVNVDIETVEKACENFYRLFEEVFGQKNCSYSIHVTGSHLLKMKKNNPITYHSAFKFENFYGEMRNMFHPGTNSTLKQILSNCFMKRILEHHVCEKTIFYDTFQKQTNRRNPGKENNYLIYVVTENSPLTMYIIMDKIDDKHYSCCKQGKFKVTMELTPEYDWSTVGVYKVGPISEQRVVIPINAISGKVIKVKHYLITCPKNVLNEQ